MALSRPFVSVMIAHKFVLNLNYFLWTGFTKTCRYSPEVHVYRPHGCHNRDLWEPRAIVPDLTMIYWFAYQMCTGEWPAEPACRSHTRGCMVIDPTTRHTLVRILDTPQYTQSMGFTSIHKLSLETLRTILELWHR